MMHLHTNTALNCIMCTVMICVSVLANQPLITITVSCYAHKRKKMTCCHLLLHRLHSNSPTSGMLMAGSLN